MQIEFLSAPATPMLACSSMHISEGELFFAGMLVLAFLAAIPLALVNLVLIPLKFRDTDRRTTHFLILGGCVLLASLLLTGRLPDWTIAPIAIGAPLVVIGQSIYLMKKRPSGNRT